MGDGQTRSKGGNARQGGNDLRVFHRTLHSADTAAIAYPTKLCKLLILLEPASGLEPLTC